MLLGGEVDSPKLIISTNRHGMMAFITLFGAVLVLVGVPLGILALRNGVRREKPGCSGNHDCVVYKGERITCPSCDLREYQAALAKSRKK